MVPSHAVTQVRNFVFLFVSWQAIAAPGRCEIYLMLRTMALVASLVTMSSVSAKDLGAFTDWNGQTFEVDGELVCSMWSNRSWTKASTPDAVTFSSGSRTAQRKRQKTELVSRWVIPSSRAYNWR